MRLSEPQAMALLDTLLDAAYVDIAQDRKAAMINLDRETVAKALEGNEDAHFNNSTRRKTKAAFDACIDPQNKQVSEFIAVAYDWLREKASDYSAEFLDAVKRAVDESVDDIWMNISCGADLKKELPDNYAEMEKICNAIKECVQVETNQEHKNRRIREKAFVDSGFTESTAEGIRDLEKNSLATNKPEGKHSEHPPNIGYSNNETPARPNPFFEDDYWQQPAESDTTAERKLPPKRKRLPIAIAAACALAAALIAIFIMHSADNAGSIEVYSSEVMSYTVAGYQQEPSTESISNIDPLTVNEAFSCLNFVRNTSKNPTMISSTTFVADEVKKIEEPVMKIEPIVADDTLLVYAINDGWGSFDNGEIELFASATNDSKRLPLLDCFAGETSQESSAIEPGAVLLLGKFDLNAERYMEIANPDGIITGGWELQIYAAIPDEQESLVGYLAYDFDNNFVIKYGGKGGQPHYSTSLFAVLNVDNGPSRIAFTSEEAAPRIEDVYRIETVIAPTRSCSIRFHEEFAVGNSAFSTDEHEAIVKVPFYATNSFANGLNGGSPLALEMSKTPNASTAELKQVAEKYRYNPENLEKRTIASQSGHDADDGLDVEYILRELAK